MEHFDTEIPAVVLKILPDPFYHGGLGVIRSLGRLGIPVYGVHEDRLAPAASSRYLHGRMFWHPDPEDAALLRHGLLRLAAHIGRPAVLIPVDDASAVFVAEHGDELRPWFIFPTPPHDLPRRLADKYLLYKMCRELNVPCATTAMPTSLAEAEEFAAGNGLPLVAKLTCQWRRGRSQQLRSTSMIHTRDELVEYYHRCEQVEGVALLLQEYIPAGPRDNWFFHGYCDFRSMCRPAFTGIKERSYPPHFGVTCLGRSVENERLSRQIEKLLTQISFRGILDIDLRWDNRDKQYKMLDFNPRLGAQFRLFQNTAGIDLVQAAYLDLTGQPIPIGAPMNGRRFVVEILDPIAALGYRYRGELNVRSWMRSLHGVTEKAWFAVDDLAPFGLVCLRMVWHGINRQISQHSARPRNSEPRYRAGRALRGVHAEQPEKW
ncbi:hypothetical protein [Frankia sp. CiP3]|uniref:carboxylate--amine ligase n=1 Tax=Frankia sp. CiP3 TaxID=2880971 RepID=UPI001EF57ADA|nr:hypothetical protein [Frankia sp. CiP3]